MTASGDLPMWRRFPYRVRCSCSQHQGGAEEAPVRSNHRPYSARRPAGGSGAVACGRLSCVRLAMPGRASYALSKFLRCRSCLRPTTPGARSARAASARLTLPLEPPTTGAAAARATPARALGERPAAVNGGRNRQQAKMASAKPLVRILFLASPPPFAAKGNREHPLESGPCSSSSAADRRTSRIA